MDLELGTESGVSPSARPCWSPHWTGGYRIDTMCLLITWNKKTIYFNNFFTWKYNFFKFHIWKKNERVLTWARSGSWPPYSLCRSCCYCSLPFQSLLHCSSLLSSSSFFHFSTSSFFSLYCFQTSGWCSKGSWACQWVPYGWWPPQSLVSMELFIVFKKLSNNNTFVCLLWHIQPAWWMAGWVDTCRLHCYTSMASWHRVYALGDAPSGHLIKS